MRVCDLQKRIEVLGVEVGFYHAHIKGVDWVRRPWEMLSFVYILHAWDSPHVFAAMYFSCTGALVCPTESNGMVIWLLMSV